MRRTRTIKPRYTVGQTLSLPYGSPAMGGGYIPAESRVVVLEALTMAGGEMSRYKVRHAGQEAWCYESALTVE